MIGRVVTGLAGRSLLRSVSGVAAGPVGAVAGVLLPGLLPKLARRLGPLGMIGAAVAGVALASVVERCKHAREAHLAEGAANETGGEAETEQPVSATI